MFFGLITEERQHCIATLYNRDRVVQIKIVVRSVGRIIHDKL